MPKSNYLLTNGLKNLENLENGMCPQKYNPAVLKKNKIKIDYDELLLFDQPIINSSPMDDLEDKDGFEELVIPDQDDLFDKKEIKVKISNNAALVDAFPNVLLLEESAYKKEAESAKISDKKPEENESDKQPDIWEIIDQLNNGSEELDILTTDAASEDEETCSQNRICVGCNSKGTFIEDIQANAMVCSECGMINEELLDHGPEWRQYNNDDNRGEGVNRCGCPSNFFFPKSSQGTIMAGSSNSRLKRKQKWNSMVYKERSLNQVFENISNICSKNNFPKIIVDTAKILYKKLSDCKHKSGVNSGKQIIIRGENRISIIAACVFKACEMNKNPRSIKEISKIFKLDEKKVTKGNKQFDKIMKNADDSMIMLEEIGLDTADDYIRRHCPKLKINKKDTDTAVKIAQNCCKMKLASDHNPQSVAAGAILLMVYYSNLKVEKKDIANLFGTSDVTIGKIYNKIAPYTEALVDDAATEHLIKKFKING